MNIKKMMKNIVTEKNPFVVLRRNRLRKRLTNKEVTFLCPNCIGGILFHDLGLKFQSPTVNLMMHQKEFAQFASYMDEYLNGKLLFGQVPSYTCPCAKLRVEGLPDVRIVFTHYHDKEEAKAKWWERTSRINKDNLFIFIEERDGLTEEDIRSLSKLNAKGIVAFTAHKYDDIPYAVHIDKYEADGEVGNILKKNHFNGAREYEKYFDFVKWFNEADGKDYDVSPFVKKQR